MSWIVQVVLLYVVSLLHVCCARLRRQSCISIGMYSSEIIRNSEIISPNVFNSDQWL